MTTLQRIQALDDFKVVRLFQQIESDMMQQVNISPDALIAQLPPEMQQMPEVQQIEKVDEKAFEKAIPSAEAIAVARQSLEWMASNPDTEEYVAYQLDNWKDTEMLAGTILAIGGALGAIMLLPTLKIGYDKKKGFQFSLGGYDEKQLEAVKLLFKSVFKLIKPGS